MDLVSLKLIELQVAIPRTMDAGKIANDLAQKGLIQQENVTETNRKKQLAEAKKVTGKERAEQSSLHTKEQQDGRAGGASNSGSTKHPFKGQKIDYSG